MAESLLEIGNIVGTHGLRGDLKVRSKSGDSDLLMSLQEICLSRPNGDMLTLGVMRRVLHKGQVLMRFQGYEAINLAEPLVGSRVLLDEQLLPDLKDDEYYWGQLKGLQVDDRERGRVGQLEEILSTAAHDTYVVEGPLGEILIPAVQQFVLDVDLEGGVIHVDLPEGLIPEKNDL